MDLKRLSWVILVLVSILLVCHPTSVTAVDIVHDDDSAPKKPGCANDFVSATSFCYLFFDPVHVFVKSILGCKQLHSSKRVEWGSLWRIGAFCDVP
ncbi:hypothetical protein LWI28_006833 [Acer negundo]|uniref:Uncharacterized protein n=1 Tax=Acer negundo TaxID=4023 RepID=A0AAD5P2T7_ACENE|nr:hypothetical protein LWI28_006833 [Acer negundo]KAK4858028.1 hypothetical protein QYF36_009902 [Acer negundo]